MMGERKEDKGSNCVWWRWVSALHPRHTSRGHRLLAPSRWPRPILGTHSSTHGLPLLAHTCHHESRPHEPSLRATAAHRYQLLRRYCVQSLYESLSV